MNDESIECGRCARHIELVDTGSQGRRWVHIHTGLIRCHRFDAMMGSAKPRSEYSAASLEILDSLRADLLISP